jgi:hypothetical protein
VEFNKRNFDKDNNDKGFNRDNRENRDGNDGGGFRERSFNRDDRNNRGGNDGGGFRERSFNRDDRNNRGGGGGGFNRGGNGGGGGFRKEFNREERPPRPIHELVHSAKFRAGKRRTYFFDVRKTEHGDHYITVTESTQRMNGGYDRHKVFLYKEDFNRFVREMTAVVEHIKTDLQPEYDYDEFERRQLEWEEQRRLEIENGSNFPTEDDDPSRFEDAVQQDNAPEAEAEIEEEDDDDEPVVITPPPVVAKKIPDPPPAIDSESVEASRRKILEEDEDMSW